MPAREKTITLAGRQYVVKELPLRQNAAWRRKLQEPFGQLAHVLGTEYEADAVGIQELLRLGTEVLLGSVDIIVDLLFDYAPALKADRERIEAEAYGDELLAAFGEVLSLAYPFEGIVKLVSASGAIKKRTT